MKPTALIVLVVLSAVSAVALWAQTPKTIPAPPDVAAPPANATKTSSGLASRVLKPGTGKTHPGKADLVTVHYTGWTTDGKMFDSSVARGESTSFPLDRVIAGWTEGVQLMVAGETRRFWIPEALAYRGQRDPRGMLVFDVELISFIESPTQAPPDVKAAPSDAKTHPERPGVQSGQAGHRHQEHPTSRSSVTVHYSGWTTDGKLFDSSVTRGRAGDVPARRRHRGLDRGRAVDGRGREDAFLDSREPRLQRPEPAVRVCSCSTWNSSRSTRFRIEGLGIEGLADSNPPSPDRPKS